MHHLSFRGLAPALALVLAMALSACGSDSGGNDSGGNSQPRDTNNNSVAEGVNGPLDAVQTPLHEQILGQLTAAAAGTPLEGTLDCVSQAVVLDLLDVVDALALALMTAAESADPVTAFDAATGDVQFALGELSRDLPGALTALAGEDCNVAGGNNFAAGGNPLEGTPLAPLGASLGPVLAQINGGGSGEDMDLQSLSELVHQLNLAFASGTAQIPAEAQSAPILGGLLTTLETAFNDLDNTLQPLALYNGEAAAGELETTLSHLLNNILTQVVPIGFIEEQAGSPGLISAPLTGAIETAINGIRLNLLDAALPPLTEALDGPLATVLDPVENQLLPTLLGPISDALSGTTAEGPTGTSLDLLLVQLTNALSGSIGDGGSNGGPTGTPLDLILGPLLAATNQQGSCPLGSTPLVPLCSVIDLLPSV